MNQALIEKFNAAMLNIYETAKSDANYIATRFFHMVGENGGLETAKYLIHSKNVSEGYTALWEMKRLDLTVESLIMDNPKYHALFTDEELAICKKRLVDYQYHNILSDD